MECCKVPYCHLSFCHLSFSVRLLGLGCIFPVLVVCLSVSFLFGCLLESVFPVNDSFVGCIHPSFFRFRHNFFCIRFSFLILICIFATESAMLMCRHYSTFTNNNA